MIISRITAKSQTTVPAAVRRALNIGPGDSIGYEVDGDHVTLKPVRLRSTSDPFVNNFSTFTEWDSEADRKAYADL
jgi:antitoxin PrlF